MFSQILSAPTRHTAQHLPHGSIIDARGREVALTEAMILQARRTTQTPRPSRWRSWLGL